MADFEVTLPPCGHTDRQRELTEIELVNAMGNHVFLLVCTVPTCPEYCRAFVDLRDPADEPEEEDASPPKDRIGESRPGRASPRLRVAPPLAWSASGTDAGGLPAQA